MNNLPLLRKVGWYKYFLLGGTNAAKVASAFAPEQTPFSHALITELNGINEMPFEMDLVKLSHGKSGLVKSQDLSDLENIWLDYQPNNLGWPLMSERMKLIIEKNLTGNEGINWISARINSNTEQKTYYVPRFEMLDVLDEQKLIITKCSINQQLMTFGK